MGEPFLVEGASSKVFRTIADTATQDFFREFSWYDQEPLQDIAKQVAHPGSRFAEVGSGKGGSAAVLGTVARNVAGHVIAVDPLRGSPGVGHHDGYTPHGVGAEFLRNMEASGLGDVVHLFVAPSTVAASAFKDAFFDLVFIDADHRYSSVVTDLSAWIPKVRPGGILCGHDAETEYSLLSDAERSTMETYLEQDCTYNVFRIGPKAHPYLHCGVVKALGERFPTGLHTSDLPGTVWWVQL